jgi:hypothetical protein
MKKFIIFAVIGAVAFFIWRKFRKVSTSTERDAVNAKVPSIDSIISQKILERMRPQVQGVSDYGALIDANPNAPFVPAVQSFKQNNLTSVNQ